jgi:hypothetical protein
MGQTIKTFLMAVLFALGVAAGPAVASPNLVQNGQFLTTSLSSPGGYVCGGAVGPTCNSTVANWGANCSSTGVCGNTSTPLSLLFPGTGGVAWNGELGMNSPVQDSPDGGNMIADDGDPTWRAPLLQTITGLTVGANYDLTFYQAADTQTGYTSPTTDQWQVSLGSATQNAAAMNTSGGQFSSWNLQSLQFSATSTSEVLSFLSFGSAGEPPVLLLADVSLTQAVPEPVTLSLLGTSLLGLVAVRQRRRRTR